MKFVFSFIAVVWGVLVVIWPRGANLVSTAPATARRSNIGEGLYKAALTHANFGMLKVQLYESTDNQPHWKIRSQFAELHRKENYSFMQDVDADFFAQKTGNIVNTTSDYGRSQLDKNLIDLEGNVRMHSKRGYLFTMNRLNYDGNTHEFHSDDTVDMKGPVLAKPSLLIKGTGLDADLDREHFILKKTVSSQKKVKHSEWLKITSQSGEFFTNDSRAIFVGKVHSALPNLSIDSDIFELSMNDESESMLARGNVRLHHRDRVGIAQSAAIEMAANRIILEGNAQIDSKTNRIRGRRITLYTDEEGRIEVEEAEGRLKR